MHGVGDLDGSLLDVALARGCSAVSNGRFKGGYITMAYGRPDDRIWAVQLELAQRAYMQESPRGEWDCVRSSVVAGHIEELLRRYVSLARTAHS